MEVQVAGGKFEKPYMTLPSYLSVFCSAVYVCTKSHVTCLHEQPLYAHKLIPHISMFKCLPLTGFPILKLLPFLHRFVSIYVSVCLYSK